MGIWITWLVLIAGAVVIYRLNKRLAKLEHEPQQAAQEQTDEQINHLAERLDILESKHGKLDALLDQHLKAPGIVHQGHASI